ncbi:hypothetical protein F2Q70_00032843, partial [Brassica cretica]
EQHVLEKERKGDYLGKTVQTMEHATFLVMRCFKKFNGLSNHMVLGSWEITFLKARNVHDCFFFVTDGSLYMATPVDPVFILLPIFDEARMKKGEDPGKFRQLDEILFVEGYPEYQHLLPLAEKCMEIVCQTQEVGSMKFYRLDNSKVLAWLSCKVSCLKKTLPELDKNYAAQGEKQTLVDAVSIVGEYLKTEPWLKLLYDHLGLEFVDPTMKETNTENLPNANENKMEYSNSIQEKATKKTGKPGKQTKQAKVETGSKNIRDMFSRACKKKC